MDEKMRIMVVDDEKIVRESLYHWFKRSGHVVETAASGFEALEKLEKVALSRPNNYWYLFTAGGFVVGAGSVLGIWVLVGR